MENTILQYQISSWKQLAGCQSNNSPELKITVSNYLQNTDIEGTKVEVKHPTYGTLFAYTIMPKGDLITDIYDSESDVMHSTTLLNELKRFGFYIDFVEEENLTKTQVEILRTIQNLKFDKIRVCAVHETTNTDEKTLYITAFNIKNHDMWINPGYSPSRTEWESAIIAGEAMNVSGLESFSWYGWDWIYNAVFDIDRLLLRYDEDAE